MKKLLLFLPIIALLVSCGGKNTKEDNSKQTVTKEESISNPPAEGFNAEASDPKAIALADEVMEAMGGRKNWDATKIISWNFFGRRKLTWNKHTGDVRIDFPDKQTTWLININKHEGRVKVGEKELTNPDSVAKYVKQGESIWINDSYWLVMPFKLKDSGVTLKLDRQDTTQAGTDASVLTLTFENVGDTPENKYEVWVEQETKLIKQWAYYPTDTAQAPRFITPWDKYQDFGNIKLSGNRGQYTLSDIQVMDSAPSGTFTEF